MLSKALTRMNQLCSQGEWIGLQQILFRIFFPLGLKDRINSQMKETDKEADFYT